MEKDRLKDYKKVIDNNEKILKIYEYLSYLSTNNKINNQTYENLKGIISKKEEENEKLLKQYDLYDQDLYEYISYLITNDEEPISKKMDIISLKNNMFIEQIKYLRNTTKFVYDKDQLYENILVLVEELGYSLHREDAIEAYMELYECSLEEATDHIDELYEKEKNIFYIEDGDSIQQREIDMDDEKEFNYLKDTYITAVYVHYLFMNVQNEENKEVRQFVYNLIYSLIALYPSVGKIFLNKEKYDINDLPEKRGLINLYNIVKYRNTFFSGWDENCMDCIDDLTDALTALECKGRLTNFDKALNIVLKSRIQASSSLIFDKDNLNEVNEKKQVMYEFLHRKSSKKLLKESDELKKKLSLTQNI